MTADTLAKVTRVNKVLGRVTWFFLTIGLIDHFIFDEWLASPIIPHVWFSRLMVLLWTLIALVVIGEVTAYILKRRLNRAAPDDAASAD